MCDALRELMKDELDKAVASGEAVGEARTLERVLKIFGVSKEEFLRMEAAQKQMAAQD